MSPASRYLETRFGLPWLFGLRDLILPPAVPERLFTITPRATMAVNENLPQRDWDRREHARAIERLRRLGVRVVAIDVYFPDPRGHQDAVLARTLRSMPGGVALVQHISLPTGPLASSVLEDPAPLIAAAATRLAPSPVPDTSIRHDVYALRLPVLRDTGDEDRRGRTPSERPVHEHDEVATLPLVALQLWQSHASRDGGDVAVESVPAEPLLNLYGGPGTIPNYDYVELIELERTLATGAADNPLRDSAVFVGGMADRSASRREDGFLTVFSDNDALMPGIEMSATAFANLRDERVLWASVSPGERRLSTFAVLLPLLLSASPLRTRRTLIAAALLALALGAHAVSSFAHAHVWLPLVTPALALAVAAAALVLVDLRVSERSRVRARGELGTFVSELIVEQLDTGRPCRLDRAVCLVSDIRGFTAMSERLSTERLHARNEGYFRLLFDCVSAHEADVVKTYGDSMTAIWRGTDAGTRERALRAGLDILARVNASGAESESPLTHIGISSGEVIVGHVGTARYRTVELTGVAVYRASRLERLNKRLETTLLASGEFAADADGLRPRTAGRHRLDGFTDPIDVVIFGSVEAVEAGDGE